MKKIVKSVVSGLLAGAFLLPLAAKAETIKIGAILAVTGGASFLGAPEARTLEMLVEEANAKGGIKGNKIELIVKDSGGSPEKAISFAKQLIEEDKVFAIIGPSTTGETMKIKQIAEDGKTLLISCAAAEVIVNPVAKYVFKTPQKDSDAVQWIFEVMKAKKISKIAVLTGNDGFGSAGKAQLEAAAPGAGVTILASEVYDKGATDLSAVVAKLKANKEIQAVVNWSIVPAQGILAKNMRQAGWEVPLFQSHGFGNIKYCEASGAAAECIIFPGGRLLSPETLPANHPQKALLMKYKADYEGRYKEPVSTFGGHAYDAFKILAKGIETAGADREKVRDAIENIKNFPGTGGIYNFSPTDHNGLSHDAFAMWTVKDGKFVPYEK